MSIRDLAEATEDDSLDTDLCIVGAGAAGIALALQFIGTGVDVVLLEAGGLAEEAATQALYQGSVADEKLHSPPDRYRQRRFGGSTTIWGGRCMPFDEIDFERRDYVAHSGWPFSRDALWPYYRDANRLCEAGDFAYTVAEAFERPLRPVIEGFTSDSFSIDTLERFSCPTDFGARYAHRLRAAATVRVILHANATNLTLEEGGQALRSVTARSLRGSGITVRAKTFVLAAGGLEVARLLLANRAVHPAGIGNAHDIVGRYYMCHVAGTLGAIQIAKPLAAVWHGYDVADDGTYCRRRFALRAAAQRTHRLANFVARLHHPRITDPRHRNAVLSLLFFSKYLIPYEYRTRLHGGEPTTPAILAQHLRNVLGDPLSAAAFAAHMLRDRTLAARKFPSLIVQSRENLYSLDFHAEQRPNPASRVSLDTDVDALGMPKLRIDWRYEAGDIDTVTRAVALLAEDIQGHGIGKFDYDPAAIEAEMTRYGAYGGHHIGTARMGTDPRSSVVNPHGRIHDVANLYIASSAIFPTSSQANPTLTIVAMALRLADHVKTALLRPASIGADRTPSGPIAPDAAASPA